MRPWDRDAHRPLILSGAERADEIAALRGSVEVFDRIRSRVGELVETRAPSRKLAPAELGAEVDRRLGPHPDRYGNWVLFPWSGRLVHALPEDEYVELRTSRNRNKISAAEQQALSRLTVGVAGLSVGQATAVTLALEGVGGTMRLAHLDTPQPTDTHPPHPPAHPHAGPTVVTPPLARHHVQQ